MKITIIGMIKNSADVIETFIRSNGLFADNFILIDNNSTDNTIHIIDNLRKEGYDIQIFSDTENAYLQSLKMNILIHKVSLMQDTDWIIPLDDDEILFSTSNNNVRSVISSFNRENAYYAKWRIYTPTEEDNQSEKCIAKRLCFAFSDDLVSERKIIFNNKIAMNDQFRIVQGNHDFIGVDIPKINQTELLIAHYPVRNKAQIISKALVGWTNYLAMPNRVGSNGAHWKQIYDYYKANFDISIEMMWQICMLYLSPDCTPEDLNVIYCPLDIDSNGYITQYTTLTETNPLLNYIHNTEQLAENYAKLGSNK